MYDHVGNGAFPAPQGLSRAEQAQEQGDDSDDPDFTEENIRAGRRPTQPRAQVQASEVNQAGSSTGFTTNTPPANSHGSASAFHSTSDSFYHGRIFVSICCISTCISDSAPKRTSSERDDDDQAEDVDIAAERRHKRKQQHNANRPRYRDSRGDDELSTLLDVVKNDLQVHFVTVTPFPSKSERDTIIQAKYKEGLITCSVDEAKHPLVKDRLRLLRQEESNMRSRLKRIVMSKLHNKYNLHVEPRSAGEVEHNRAWVAFLLGPEPLSTAEPEDSIALTQRSVFHCKEPEKRVGHFQNSIIEEVIFELAFSHVNALGCLNQERFKPISHPLIASILTSANLKLTAREGANWRQTAVLCGISLCSPMHIDVDESGTSTGVPIVGVDAACLHFLDPATLQFVDIPDASYLRTPFESLAGVADLVEFTVLDVEPSGQMRGKSVLADAQVALSGAFASGGGAEDDAMDGGVASQILHTRTHLGAILQPGDAALGYYLTNANFNSDAFGSLPAHRVPDAFASLPVHRVPDVILVKKAYPNCRLKKNKPRNWRLRSIAREASEEGDTSADRGVVGPMGGRDKKKVEEDCELFLRDLEEDEEMRCAVNLYHAKDARPTLPHPRWRALFRRWRGAGMALRKLSTCLARRSVRRTSIRGGDDYKGWK
ncbi:uncharacterized protein C8Q71DRAFT_877618 [Rhodofomes roseus]|uniref:Uncharacterized protein n=1 Tax=Rhodofomes roseus TaxID=34475 RepID=A0ABQ8KX68_9APHY|nr:uncharacterized protein C8Q71DRAFT_877618 [Rhodofomes roseus]KAH9842963.1 hypothetical protein C8Q71DRAFT_877618 [Rhodofomes roseus]